MPSLFSTRFNAHGSLEDHFLVVRMPLLSQLTFTSHLFLRFCIVSTVSLSLAGKSRVSYEDFERTFECLQSLQTRHFFCNALVTSRVASSTCEDIRIFFVRNRRTTHTGTFILQVNLRYV